MKRVISVVGAAFALSLSASPASAATLMSYSNVLVFGDSLVDAGNARIGSLQLGLPDPTPTGLGYKDGRFTNGPNFADYINRGVTGSDTRASLAGGTNFAFGGALASPTPAIPQPSFEQQVAPFAPNGLTIAPDALVVVTFGGNDVRQTALTGGTVTFDASIAAFRSGLTTLIDAGARNLLVTGVPDIGQLPAVRPLAAIGPNRPAELTARSEALNSAIRSLTYNVSYKTGADVDFFDLFKFQKTLFAQPGFTLNRTTPCQSAPGAIDNGCQGYVYLDGIHPTTQVHELIAGGIAARLAAVPEPGTWALMIAGIGATGGIVRRRRNISAQAA